MNLDKIRQDLLVKLQIDNKVNTKSSGIILGENYMALVNYGKHLKGLYPTLCEELAGFNADLEQLWIKSTTQMVDVGGKEVRAGRVDVFFEEPIIRCDCSHVILIASDSVELLKHANKIGQRYLSTYSKMLKLEKNIFPMNEIKYDAIDMCNKAQANKKPGVPRTDIPIRPITRKKTFLEKLANKLVKVIKVLLS